MSVIFVTQAAEVDDVISAINGASRIAIDTEFIRERTYYPRLCLVQLAIDRQAWCLDPLGELDIAPAIEAIYASSAIKIFHAARQDLEIFFQMMGKTPAPLFDTQVAAALTGRHEQIAYAGLVSELCAVELDKSSSRTDWSLRPLRKEQLAYAAADVQYLEQMYDALRSELHDLGRYAWFEEECLRLQDPELYAVAPQTAWTRIKGLAKLDGRARAVAANLARWREQQAQRRDLPRGWVIKDPSLIALAQAAPQSKAELLKVEGLAPALVRRNAETLLNIIAQAKLNDIGLSVHVAPRLTSEGKSVVQHLLAELQTRASELGISPSVIATRRDVEAVIAGDADARTLEGWRFECFGHLIEKTLSENQASLFIEQ